MVLWATRRRTEARDYMRVHASVQLDVADDLR